MTILFKNSCNIWQFKSFHTIVVTIQQQEEFDWWKKQRFWLDWLNFLRKDRVIFYNKRLRQIVPLKQTRHVMQQVLWKKNLERGN